MGFTESVRDGIFKDLDTTEAKAFCNTSFFGVL